MTRALPVLFLCVVAMCPCVRVVGIEMINKLLRVKALRRRVRSTCIVDVRNGCRLDVLLCRIGRGISSTATNGCQQVSATAAFTMDASTGHDGSHEDEQRERYRWTKSWIAIPPRLATKALEGRRRRRRGRVLTTRRVIVLDAAVVENSALLLHLDACPLTAANHFGYLTSLSYGYD